MSMNNKDNRQRVELHIHSKMSAYDGFNEIEDIVRTAAYQGQPAVAITDHGVVQAFPDAARTAEKLAEEGVNIKVIYGMEGYLYPDEETVDENGVIDITKNETSHAILLAQNKTGLKNLCKLVSLSHIEYFFKKPILPRSVIDAHRDGLIIGSACDSGEVYRAVLNGVNDNELDRIASYYDYLEIQPLENNQFMIDEGIVNDRNDLINNNKRILACADRLGKLCCATTDAHYPTPESSIYRKIVKNALGYMDTESDAMHMRTTDEMLAEFDYLGNRAEEVVIDNTNKIADMVEELQPIPKARFIPKIDGADEILKNSCYERAESIYGNPLPAAVQERLDTELNSIISNGNAVMYVAAQKLVEKSNADGYFVGSRGAVGSSFAATMAGITEVNPLAPHYICPECKHFEFAENPDKYDCGLDMPDKICPKCGRPMNKDGMNIPYEIFLGFEGNKEPDIDLNFVKEYQEIALKYAGEIFGKKNVFRAGTVAILSERAAYGYVRNYLDEKGIAVGPEEVDRLVKGCAGVKRTTGLHPGGIMVIPDSYDICEFSPVQRPANRVDADIISTHFDYHKIDQCLLKLDILGHDVPQRLRKLQLMTGVDPMTIPLRDSDTLSLFASPDALKIKNPNYRFTHGTYAIPEFGTAFVRQMLDDAKPTTVSALISISGLAHGSGTWYGNAQELLREGTASIDEVISSRDDIMNYLVRKGLNDRETFGIMERVRMGRELSEDQIDIMKEHGVPDWYIQSCEKIQYLFPKAHAASYVMMSLRMAWFKVYYPKEFYTVYFASLAESIDACVTAGGLVAIEKKLDELTELGYAISYEQKEQIAIYEVMYEMYSRGYEFDESQSGVSVVGK